MIIITALALGLIGLFFYSASSSFLPAPYNQAKPINVEVRSLKLRSNDYKPVQYLIVDYHFDRPYLQTRNDILKWLLPRGWSLSDSCWGEKVAGTCLEGPQISEDSIRSYVLISDGGASTGRPNTYVEVVSPASTVDVLRRMIPL